MDYRRFAQLRGPAMDDLERGLETARRRPRELSYEGLEGLAVRYRQVLHDHALAAARFPATAAAERLRRLALEGTHRLGAGGEESGRRRGPVAFFTRTFPRAFRAQLDLLGLAALLFAATAALGLLTTAARPALGVAFIGEEAREGLAEGRLWTDVLTTVPPEVSSSAIATNNMSVAITAWAGGATAGLLTLYILLLNGLMLGAVVGVTLHYSMAGELGGFLAAHGPLEITVILVAAASGLAVARALVAAGDRPRGEALRAAARSALAVLLGVLPWLVVLGAVETWVSPAPDVPAAAKVALGLALEALFWIAALNPFRPREETR
jgi:uncharacterized membrane protein SpoIIM required for sporulation